MDVLYPNAYAFFKCGAKKLHMRFSAILAPMTDEPKAHGGRREGSGRKHAEDADLMKNRVIRVDDARWQKCQDLGGAKWIRAQIDAAPEPRESKRRK